MHKGTRRIATVSTEYPRLRTVSLVKIHGISRSTGDVLPESPGFSGYIGYTPSETPVAVHDLLSAYTEYLGCPGYRASEILSIPRYRRKRLPKILSFRSTEGIDTRKHPTFYLTPPYYTPTTCGLDGKRFRSGGISHPSRGVDCTDSCR